MSGRSRGTFAVFLMVLMVLGAFPVFLPQASAAPTPHIASALSLSVVPLRLPADGNTYAALVVGLVDSLRNPSLAFTATTVYLTSSSVDVGTVPATVVIQPGQDYAIVSFTTTDQSGVTAVTASAAGLSAVSVLVNTRVPSGYAERLKLVATPSSVIAGTSGAIVIQLEDATSQPAVASYAVNVSLSSSSLGIVQTTAKNVIIPAGHDLAFVNFTTSYSLGSAFVTATASSFVSASTSIAVTGASPYALHVNAQPEQVIAGGAGRVVVWLTDQVGHPAIAAAAISVSVASSNLSVAQFVQTTVVIRAGQTYGTANYTAGLVRGSATVTVAAQNLQTGFDTITTFPNTLRPAGIRLYVGPNPVVANSGTYSAIAISLVNSQGSPAVASSSITVNITSANTAVGTVSKSVVIVPGKETAYASFSSAYLVGTAIITTTAQNLLPAQTQISTYGPVPSSVVVTPISATVLANGATDDVLSLSLQDGAGNAAVAPSPIIVHLTSSQPSITSVPAYVTIATGRSYVLTSVQTGILAGTTNITASAANYGASSALLSTTIPAPTGIRLYVGPVTGINQTAGKETMISVQLQDANGLPASASQPTNIVITSSNTSVIKQPIFLRVNPGQDYATAFVSSIAPGRTNLTASAAGLGSASAVMVVLASPTVVTVSPSTQVPYTNETSIVTLTAQALGQGLSEAHVVWSSNFGILSQNNGTTNAQGQAFVVVSSPQFGVATVTATVTGPIIGVVNASTTIVFQSIPVPPTVSFSQRLGSYLYVIIAVIILAVAVVAAFFIRRRRRSSGGTEETGPADTEPYDELEEQPDVTETGEGTLAWGRGGPSFGGVLS